MIFGTYGRGGSGKSARTVSRLWKLFKRDGRDIVSNTPLIDLGGKEGAESRSIKERP